MSLKISFWSTQRFKIILMKLQRFSKRLEVNKDHMCSLNPVLVWNANFISIHECNFFLLTIIFSSTFLHLMGKWGSVFYKHILSIYHVPSMREHISLNAHAILEMGESPLHSGASVRQHYPGPPGDPWTLQDEDLKSNPCVEGAWLHAAFS